MQSHARRVGSGRAFTLIELLVVVAVIAVLIGVLLPALGLARGSSRAIVAANNLRSVAQGVAIYTGDSDDFFPPSYVYASSRSGEDWKLEDQLNENPNPTHGYLHWSWFLFESGSAGADAFTNPAVLSGGAPATNPGADFEDWEPGQEDDLSRTIDSLPPQDSPYPKDRQVPRMAFTGNEAIFPRNKFATSTPRKNQLVRANKVGQQSNTILATEFAEADSWGSVGEKKGGNVLIKSHRSLMPFVETTGGTPTDDWYFELTPGEPDDFEYFRYPFTGNDGGATEIRPEVDISKGAIIESQCKLSVVGRHHPGSGAESTYGGAANFVFIDGHIERKNVVETIRERQWGDRMYSLTGYNKVYTKYINEN